MPIYRFPPFEFNPGTGRLTKHGRRIKLQPKLQVLLTALLQERGTTLSRQILFARLWPEGTFVDFDQGLSVAVKKLRNALGDSSDQPNYVATVAGSGYRFIATVEDVELSWQGSVDAATGETYEHSTVPVGMESQPVISRKRVLTVWPWRCFSYAFSPSLPLDPCQCGMV